MDARNLISRCKQFGGAILVWQYVKLGVLWPALRAGVRCLVKRQSFKAIYPEVLRKIEPYLVSRYGSVLRGKKEEVRVITMSIRRLFGGAGYKAMTLRLLL